VNDYFSPADIALGLDLRDMGQLSTSSRGFHEAEIEFIDFIQKLILKKMKCLILFLVIIKN
jgi:hypothetical protein